MATRSCPQCGAQYVASVRRCIDCDLILVDEVEDADEGPAGSSGSPLGEGDQIGYELDGWGNQLKVTLEGMLDRAGIRRVWEAGALVVSAADEDAVDDLIATLEGEEVLDLDDEVERIAFEIEDLDADGRAELDARLLADGVAHAWTDEGELVVAASDEEQVVALIEAVLEGDDGDVDGLAAQEVLSALYVSTDRLLKAPLEPKLGAAFAAAVGALEGLAVPYGFSTDDWTGLRGEAEAVAALIRPGAPDEDEDEADVDQADADVATEVGEVDDEAGDEAGDDGDGGSGGTSAEERARSAVASLRARLLEFV